MEEPLSSILHIGKYYPPYNGGMETHLRDLAVRQVLTFPVSVVVANNEPTTDLSFIDRVEVMRVARLGSIASMPICPTLPYAIRSRPAEIVHLHTPNPGGALAFLLSGHKGRLVITHHSDTLGRKTLRQLSQPFVTEVMQRATAIIVTSQRYLDSSEELAPYFAKCHVIPLGIETSYFAEDEVPGTAAIRSLYGNKIVIAIGRLVSYKGFDVLIKAMKEVDGKLLLIGSGPLEDEMKSLIEQEGLRHKVIMLGKVDDIRPYYQAASIFVLPSRNRAEAFGLVQLEAMASGLPVINTTIDSGAQDLSLHGETGLTVPPDDARALADSISLLLADDLLRNRFASAARLRVALNFSADQMATRVLNLYSRI